ncbi:MAG TPA: CBS domain-containing protein [Bacillota bacterium]|nr:CBS domain-containing protein [Bacillota bacterium]HPF42020.1 CBS domain-containing protein [Bacillota bacterium]HPQ61800.1 CBS domain-containing protein [Bacillota bacterium]HRX91223.1 CBS domain-containing protein [Candidatus Izemoplasmatales bacterium]
METAKVDIFMDTFRSLESYLRVEYDRGNYREQTFMNTLFRIRGRQENHIIQNPQYFDILQQAAQLRNVIAHNNDVAEPTDTFLKKFQRITRMIVSPVRVSNVMIPMSRIKKASTKDKIADIMDTMDRYGYSKIPVFSGQRLLGVFTKNTFFYKLLTDKPASINRDMRMENFLDVIDFDGDPTKYFDFIRKDADIFEALTRFRRNFREKNHLEMLFVTENGKKEETILGIVTLPDLEESVVI